MRALLITATIFFCSAFGIAQNKVKFFTTNNSGIPSNFIASLLMDSKDNLWVGTNDKGIGMYDGKTWTYYNTGNTPVLDSDYINDIKEHPNGDVWFGTDIGVAVLSNGNWTFHDSTNFGSNLLKQYYLQFDNNGNAFTLTIDRVGTIVKLYKFENNSWSLYHEDTDSVLHNFNGLPIDFAINKNNVVWVKNGYYLNSANAKWNAVPKPGNTFNQYDGCIAVDLADNVWFTGRRNKYTKISVPLSWNGSVTAAHDTMKSYNNITWEQIIRVNPYDGTVWYANIDNTVSGFSYPKRGLCEWFDGTDWNSDQALTNMLDSATNKGFRQMSVKAITFDKQGNTWFGLNNQGSYRKQFPDSGGIILFNVNGINQSNFPIGISDIDEDDRNLNVYPNPINRTFNVVLKNSSGAGKMVIHDAFGRLVREETFSSGSFSKPKQITLDQPAGLYILRILVEDKVYSKQLILN